MSKILRIYQQCGICQNKLYHLPTYLIRLVVNILHTLARLYLFVVFSTLYSKNTSLYFQLIRTQLLSPLKCMYTYEFASSLQGDSFVSNAYLCIRDYRSRAPTAHMWGPLSIPGLTHCVKRFHYLWFFSQTHSSWNFFYGTRSPPGHYSLCQFP